MVLVPHKNQAAFDACKLFNYAYYTALFLEIKQTIHSEKSG